MSVRHVIVLAAGRGTRMKATRPKVLHKVAGQPMIHHVLKAAASLEPSTTTVIVGHQAKGVETAVRSMGYPQLEFVHQKQQQGTAHALLQAEQAMEEKAGTLVVLSGDVPLITSATLKHLANHHESLAASATLLTAKLEQPYGYGRVARIKGVLARIIEEADASPAQRRIQEVNAGIYAFDLQPLFAALHEIPEAGPKQERYLPAILNVYQRRRLRVESTESENPHEIRGVNSQAELAEMSNLMRQIKNQELMAAGVTIMDPSTTYIDRDVMVGSDTVIHPGVTLEGRTVIGSRCELHSGTRILDSSLGDEVTVNNHCVIIESSIDTGARVGPFAHLRPDSNLGPRARVGNFVEIKNSTIGNGSKANHLSYVGDAIVEAGVNIGAGTITCNYDGATKHQTKLESGVFVGSGTQLVAPVTVGRGAYVGAGSCITDDVPPGALGIARGRQTNKLNWVKKDAD